MFKPTGDSFYLEIVCPDGNIYERFWYLKEIIFERVIFGRSALWCLHVTLTFRTAKTLCPNLQKPPLPSKIPGYAPVMLTIVAELPKFSSQFTESLKELKCRIDNADLISLSLVFKQYFTLQQGLVSS